MFHQRPWSRYHQAHRKPAKTRLLCRRSDQDRLVLVDARPRRPPARVGRVIFQARWEACCSAQADYQDRLFHRQMISSAFAGLRPGSDASPRRHAHARSRVALLTLNHTLKRPAHALARATPPAAPPQALRAVHSDRRTASCSAPLPPAAVAPPERAPLARLTQKKGYTDNDSCTSISFMSIQ